MLATIRVDDEQSMAVLSYTSPAFERSRARAESAGDRGRAFRAVFAPFPEDKENADPNGGAAHPRKMDPRTPRDRCEPSRPPLADITPKFLTPNKLTPGKYTLHSREATMKKSFTGARNLFPSERHDGLRTGALGDDGVEKTELPVTRRLSVRNVR